MSDPVPRRVPALRDATRDDFLRLLPYVAALELEVDRLRRHNRLVHQETRAALAQVRQLCAGTDGPSVPAGPLAEVARVVEGLEGVLHDLQEAPGYHPAHDQVVAIAVRPLAEQVFRWQQRLRGATDVTLRLELETEHVDWFPARLRHILDNLFSNALKYRDPAKTEAWVRLGLRASAEGYEFRVSDNGVGMPPQERDQLLDLFYRAGPARAAGLGVGLAVVKLLVEQSGGSLTVDAGEGQGTSFVVVLPRYDLDDFLL
jgi:signal transduction histidine kinase